jgi:hypothetical protein
LQLSSKLLDFPWNQLPAGTVVCDVGGGVGDISVQLAKCYPKLRLILHDLPKQVDDAEKKFWPEYCPEAIAEHRIDFIPLDFFKESPTGGCDIYFVRSILMFLHRTAIFINDIVEKYLVCAFLVINS